MLIRTTRKYESCSAGKPAQPPAFADDCVILDAYYSSTMHPYSPRMFRTAFPDFLPSELEPLGFSADAWFIVQLFGPSSESGHSMVTLNERNTEDVYNSQKEKW